MSLSRPAARDAHAACYQLSFSRILSPWGRFAMLFENKTVGLFSHSNVFFDSAVQCFFFNVHRNRAMHALTCILYALTLWRRCVFHI